MVAYYFSFKTALVKGSPNVVAANASVLIYDVTDVNRVTPITAYSDAALTTITNLVSDAYGVIPDFYTDNRPDILWKSGTNKGQWATSQSRPGLPGPRGLPGADSTVPGPQGIPGLNGAGTNAAVAAYIPASGPTRDALDARFLRSSLVVPDSNLPTRLGQAALDTAYALPTRLSQTSLDAKYGPQADPVAAWSAALQNQKNAAAKYVNLGDSIANGGNPTAGSRAWVNRVTALLTNRAADRLDAATLATPATTGVHVYNGAVGGTTSANYLTDALVTRIGTIQPQLITHMVKANDQGAGMTPATYRANLLSWINKIKAVSANTVHVLINEHDRYDLASPAYSGDQYRDQLISLAASETNVVFLDIGKEFKTHGIPGSERYGLMDTDNLHFKDDGNRIYARIIGKFIGAPSPDYIPREIRKATTFVTTVMNSGSSLTFASFTIAQKPYLREGVVSFDIYGLPAGSVDVIPRITPSGGSRIDLHSHRLQAVRRNHASSVPVTLEPNVSYTAYLDLGVYGSDTFDPTGSSFAYNKFFADVSPI